MILLYHSIIPDDSPAERWSSGQAMRQSDFEHQIHWLARRRPIVPLSDYVTRLENPASDNDKPVAVTFDDGFRVTFQCIFPFLTEMHIPATIFVSTGHLESGDLLWFSYLKALCFEDLYKMIEVDEVEYSLQTLGERREAWDKLRVLARSSGNPTEFCKILAQKYPLKPEISNFYGGMTHDQIKAAGRSNLLDIGAHTVTHPFLDQIGREAQKQEIVNSKHMLADLSGTPIRYFAYPGWEYNHESLELVKDAGFEAAFAVIPKELGEGSHFEIGRVGIYSTSLLKLQLKTMGVANLARRFGLRVG